MSNHSQGNPATNKVENKRKERETKKETKRETKRETKSVAREDEEMCEHVVERKKVEEETESLKEWVLCYVDSQLAIATLLKSFLSEHIKDFFWETNFVAPRRRTKVDCIVNCNFSWECCEKFLFFEESETSVSSCEAKHLLETSVPDDQNYLANWLHILGDEEWCFVESCPSTAPTPTPSIRSVPSFSLTPSASSALPPHPLQNQNHPLSRPSYDDFFVVPATVAIADSESDSPSDSPSNGSITSAAPFAVSKGLSSSAPSSWNVGDVVRYWKENSTTPSSVKITEYLANRLSFLEGLRAIAQEAEQKQICKQQTLDTGEQERGGHRCEKEKREWEEPEREYEREYEREQEVEQGGGEKEEEKKDKEEEDEEDEEKEEKEKERDTRGNEKSDYRLFSSQSQSQSQSQSRAQFQSQCPSQSQFPLLSERLKAPLRWLLSDAPFYFQKKELQQLVSRAGKTDNKPDGKTSDEKQQKATLYNISVFKKVDAAAQKLSKKYKIRVNQVSFHIVVETHLIPAVQVLQGFQSSLKKVKRFSRQSSKNATPGKNVGLESDKMDVFVFVAANFDPPCSFVLFLEKCGIEVVTLGDCFSEWKNNIVSSWKQKQLRL